MWKNYYTPTSLQKALELLDEFQPDARIIAGGTDLILEIEKGICKLKNMSSGDEKEIKEKDIYQMIIAEEK
jgi:CO/xanthine dehydrogenase FAD-binding subunit